MTVVRGVGQVGSSPHARGALGPRCSAGRHRRLIPACAGSTQQMQTYGSDPRAHPRMRGEHAVVLEGGGGAGGSSPHARGALIGARLPVPSPGLIPACAGSTQNATR